MDDIDISSLSTAAIKSIQQSREGLIQDISMAGNSFRFCVCGDYASEEYPSITLTISPTEGHHHIL
ncbi:MAG: hypothetical protein OEY79_00245 [Anaplasmataceae bacterium]|nr:hypothetical protein [Anaplasmataceae bacterium]